MLKVRVMPCLLLQGESLVKTIKFNKRNYIGDAINTVRIFNEMEVDELIFLDINASKEGRGPNFSLLKDIASECFMPICYGGGLRRIEDLKEIFAIGVEKVSLNTYAFENPEFISKAADLFGSQSIIASIDVKKNLFGKYEAVVLSGTKKTKLHPVEYAQMMEKYGAGEILLTSVDRDGTWDGYDLELIKQVTDAVKIPVIVCGGASKTEDFKNAVDAGASALAAGSMFIFQAKGFGVLVNFPNRTELNKYIDA